MHTKKEQSPSLRDGEQRKNTKEADPKGVGTDQRNTREEIPESPDPTRYGDWEKNGRCIDF